MPEDDDLGAEREAAIAAWTNRALSQIITDGFDTDACVREPAPDEMIVDDAGVAALGWAFLPLPLEVEELDSSSGRSGPAVVLDGDAIIPFSGECESVTAFEFDIGDPLTEIPILRTDAYRRAELAGLTGDEMDFADCRNPEPGLSRLVGFGGDDVGLAFGPWPADAATFTDIDLEEWMVLPPVGHESPAFAERGSDGFPDDAGLDPDGWLFTFVVEQDRAVVQPGWDLSPALPGGEQVVIETLELLMTDARVRAEFREWTPCTYKLCESNNEVER